MTDKWITKPLTNAELTKIRQDLEDGNIPNTTKYAVIQRLIESHLLANKIADENYEHGLRFADALDAMIDVLDGANMVTRVLEKK